jgi:hypothetical protein
MTYLNKFVPPGTNNDRVLRVRTEPHARDPFSVAFFGDGEFAVSESVPELDGTIARARNDLPVICGEGN